MFKFVLEVKYYPAQIFQVYKTFYKEVTEPLPPLPQSIKTYFSG